MNIEIKTIPHDRQRYPTCGDWRRGRRGTLEIRVSDMGNDDFHALVAIHELVEALLCEKRGIREEDVTAFDIAFKGDEPGDDPAAPYHAEHQTASLIEKVVADALGIDWKAYERAIKQLP